MLDSDADGSDIARILSHLPYLDDSDWAVRARALRTLGKLEPAILAQHAHDVLARLEDSDWIVRREALATLGKLEPTTLAQHADAVLAMLEDSDWNVRRAALCTLGELMPATLAQHAHDVLARLEDSNCFVRRAALETLGKLKPATLAQHADAVVARLRHLSDDVDALKTLGKLEPEALALHANALIAKLEESSFSYRYPDANRRLLETLRALPRFIIRDIDSANPISGLRPWLLGRLAWYRCRLRLRVRRLALYWYALPYRPNGPGHARDVEAWGRILEE